MVVTRGMHAVSDFMGDTFAGSPRPDRAHRIVRGRVVDKNDLSRCCVGFTQRLETGDCVVRVVEARDDDCPGRGIELGPGVPTDSHSRGAGATDLDRRWYAVIAAPASRKKL